MCVFGHEDLLPKVEVFVLGRGDLVLTGRSLCPCSRRSTGKINIVYPWLRRSTTEGRNLYLNRESLLPKGETCVLGWADLLRRRKVCVLCREDLLPKVEIVSTAKRRNLCPWSEQSNCREG